MINSYKLNLQMNMYIFLKISKIIGKIVLEGDWNKICIFMKYF